MANQLHPEAWSVKSGVSHREKKTAIRIRSREIHIEAPSFYAIVLTELQPVPITLFAVEQLANHTLQVRTACGHGHSLKETLSRYTDYLPSFRCHFELLAPYSTQLPVHALTNS